MFISQNHIILLKYLTNQSTFYQNLLKNYRDSYYFSKKLNCFIGKKLFLDIKLLIRNLKLYFFKFSFINRTRKIKISIV